MLAWHLTDRHQVKYQIDKHQNKVKIPKVRTKAKGDVCLKE